jgi:hypothetical protein
MVFGRSGGVQGHGMDHTNRFPRTLAGFGLTWHGGNRFSCFLEILETHFITKYLQIGPRASRLVLGVFGRPGHQIKPISFPKNDPKNIFVGNLVNLPKSSVFDKMASFSFFVGPQLAGFSCTFFPGTPHTHPTPPAPKIYVAPHGN